MSEPDSDLRNTAINREATSQARALLAELISKACQRGFNGEFTLTLVSHNGTITEVRDTTVRRHRVSKPDQT